MVRRHRRVINRCDDQRNRGRDRVSDAIAEDKGKGVGAVEIGRWRVAQIGRKATQRPTERLGRHRVGQEGTLNVTAGEGDGDGHLFIGADRLLLARGAVIDPVDG